MRIFSSFIILYYELMEMQSYSILSTHNVCRLRQLIYLYLCLEAKANMLLQWQRSCQVKSILFI